MRSALPSSRVTSKPEARCGAGGAGGDTAGGAGDELPAVPGDLVPSGGQQLDRWKPVGTQEAVHMGSRGVARLPGVHHGDPPPGAGQDQGGR